MNIIQYQPKKLTVPSRIINVPTAWVGLESIIADIMDQFNVNNELALEFGVDYGYSTAALANYFKKVIAVDTFKGDYQTGYRENLKEEARRNLAEFPTVELIESDFRDFIAGNEEQYDMIHIDLLHEFETTYQCGAWAVKHAPVVICHGTECFQAVKQALLRIAEENGFSLFNYPLHHGLGILVKPGAVVSQASVKVADPSGKTHGGVMRFPDGWMPFGRGAVSTTDEGSIIFGDHADEAGITTEASFENVQLIYDVKLDASCRFISAIHQAIRGASNGDSYRLLLSPDGSYFYRDNLVFARIVFASTDWHTIAISWMDGDLRLLIDGDEICRCFDHSLHMGFCAIGCNSGTAHVRQLCANSSITLGQADLALPAGWRPIGAGARLDSSGIICLAVSEARGGVTGLLSELDYHEVELDFKVQLSNDAVLIAKVHHQDPDNSNANSYHLVSAASGAYFARAGVRPQRVEMDRNGWQHIVLRRLDWHLEVFVGGVLRARIPDGLLQGGYCFLGLAAGTGQLRDIRIRDLSGPVVGAPSIIRRVPRRSEPISFTSMPRRNLIYHIWPVRDSVWRWNLEQLRARIDLFNGRRLISIVYDNRAEEPDAVKNYLEGHGCDFFVGANDASAQSRTFSTMLRSIASTDANEVTYYGHAKGVSHGPVIPGTLRRWIEVSYLATLDDWLTLREHLQRFALTGAFRMVGRFRAHQYIGDWHYSGAYFWLRHAAVFGRDWLEMSPSYYGVELWPGMHFAREETGCLLFENLRQAPWEDQFWRSVDQHLERCKARIVGPPPPCDLVNLLPFDGYRWPRLEQRPDEFAWFLQRLAEARPRSLLTIGAMYGGVEWHVARRFRNLGMDIEITAIEGAPRTELIETLDDARRRFGQNVNLIIGDSNASVTHEQLSLQYDAVFIDGNHSYRCCQSDFQLALSRHARIIGLHDIIDSDFHAQERICVSRLWAELRRDYATDEKATGNWGGIGIVNIG